MTDPLDPAIAAAIAMAGPLTGGDRRTLARAITLAESTRPDHRAAAEALIGALLATGLPSSLRIGISGVPGVGKSSFIEAFGRHLIAEGHRVAVLAVDPSSPRTGGAILGDKTRMELLSRDLAAFIRPSPAGITLGGVARRTGDCITLVEAAGFDIVLVETVGVGQSETAVADLTDLFCLLLPPAGGDDLQGIKKGIVELADLLVVTKLDGDTRPAAQRAIADYRSALQMLRRPDEDWRPRILGCSSTTGDGIAEVWAAMQEFHSQSQDNGRLQHRRADQRQRRFWTEITASLQDWVRRDPVTARDARVLEAAVAEGRLAPALAARQLLAALRGESVSSR